MNECNYIMAYEEMSVLVRCRFVIVECKETGILKIMYAGNGVILVLHLFTHSLIHTFIHSFTHSFTYLFIHSFTHSCIHTLTHSLTHSCIHTFTHSLTHSLIHSFVLTMCLSHSLEQFMFMHTHRHAFRRTY